MFVPQMITNVSGTTPQGTPSLIDQPSIAIVGGSITGPTLALLLRKAGFTDVSVFEASPEPTAQAGGVIGLDHTSLGMLDTVGVPQEEIVPFPSERVVSIAVADRNETGRVQTIYPGRNSSWSVLNTSLLARLPQDKLYLGRRVKALSTSAGRAVLEFKDADPVAADLVVFADGRRSTGRQLLDPDRHLTYAGYVAWRGQLPYCPPELSDFTRFEHPGTQFNIFPILGNDGTVSTDWTFYLNVEQQHFVDMVGGDPTRRTFVLPHQISEAARQFVQEHARQLLPPEASTIIDATPRWTAAPVIDIDEPARMVYPDSRAVLIGDALAPVRPHTARGANNGIEQAGGLVTALYQHARYGADLDATLSGWQQRYLPGVHAAVRQGPKLGSAMGLGHPSSSGGNT